MVAGPDVSVVAASATAARAARAAHPPTGTLPTAGRPLAGRPLGDRDIRAVAHVFPALCVLTLALPLAVGWAIGGTWLYNVTALLWAGPVRIALFACAQ